MIKAILFDMDGVLIDSEKYISEAAIEFFSRRGIQAKPEDFIPFVGAGEDRYIGGVAEKYQLRIDIEEAKIETYTIYKERISGKESALPGVLRCIQNLHTAQIPMAVATSADKMKMEINLEAMGIDTSYFTACIHGKNVERKKPFPDIYLTAAKQLGVSAEECLVFEDATNGVQAAVAAGALCGGITTSFTKDQLRAEGADFIIQGLDDLPNFSTLEEFQTIILMARAKELATEARLHAYAPYSKFLVGAALVSEKSGNIYSGCNVENSSYGATICAERGAIMKAIAAEGNLAINMLVVVTDDDPPAVPCAQCLQVLAEFAQPDTSITLFNLAGERRSYRFRELLPYPFVLKKD